MGRMMMNQKRYRMYTIGGSCILLLCIVISLCAGRYTISVIDCIRALLGLEIGDGTAANVIYNLRLPRTLAAALIGMALSASGLVYQSVFRNKFISPDILGVSSGACVGAAIAIILNMPRIVICVLALCGGTIAVAIALWLPMIIKNRSTMTLVLSGIIVSSFMTSLVGVFKFMADPEDQLAEITFWMMGSLDSVQMIEVYYIIPTIFICLATLFLLRWRINAVSLGEETARSLGVDYKYVRLMVIGCSTLLTAVSVSISGTIGWVGLVVPHFARMLAGEDHKYNFSLSILIGGIFMVVVDMLARTLSTNEIPLSIITGFLGTPIYVILLMKKGGYK